MNDKDTPGVYAVGLETAAAMPWSPSSAVLRSNIEL